MLARDWWDPARRLLTHPGGLLGGTQVAPGAVGLPRATAWWVHGLLRRSQPGDRELAELALGGVLAQHDAAAEPGDAVGGLDAADRRVLVGAALALVVRDHDLPEELAADVRAAVERVVRADHPRPVDVTRTSIAVQRAWLELEVGRWRDDQELLATGAELAQAVAADSGTRGHVAEHIGPSVTGLVLLGLSLWAERPPVPDLAALGRALRDEVWHDLLAVWHPGLLTLVPPFARAWGMDLRTHVGATAPWLAWLVDGIDPLPPLHGRELHQGHHLPMVFLVDALAGASQDVRALAPLVRAQPARQGEWFDRVGERVWTGWTGADLAVGAEFVPVEQDGFSHAVPAAAIWRADGGENAWLRLQQDGGAVEARVEHDRGIVRLVHGTRDASVRLLLGGVAPDEVTSDRVRHGGRTWRLDGVAEVAEVAAASTGVPQVAAAWDLAASGDGIVLHTTEA